METQKNRLVRVAVIGAGLIGKERIKALSILKKRGKLIDIVGIYDPYSSEIDSICNEYQTKSINSIQQIKELKSEWAILAVPHNEILSNAIPLLDASIKVLIEKPLGRNVVEAREIISHAKFKDQLAIGFNYRFFEGIRKAILDAKEGKFGEIISLNLFLGHGGDPKLTTSWKFNQEKAGGGCLLDPGIHLFDLARLLFNNDLKVINAIGWNGFWKTGIEEESSILLMSNKSLITIQVSVVKWNSTFRMEINGTEGYGIVTGRGRSYGPQLYVRGKRWGWLSGKTQADSEEKIINSNGTDVFADELDAMLFNNTQYGVMPCTPTEALYNMEIWESTMKNLKLVKGKE